MRDSLVENEMKKIVLGVLLTIGVGFPQPIVSKLNGKRISLQRQDAGHQDGYNGMVALLQSNASVYGYTFEYSANPLTETALNAVFSRLYKPGVAHTSSTIDILIFCQGEGDRNASGPFANPTVRFGQINTHVKSGGGLMSVHGAHGREVSWDNWIFGANLMTDWFVDGYFASAAFSGNGGHFSSGTLATMTVDSASLPTRDSSTFFIRNIMTLPTAQKGYGQPLTVTNVQGEWYHFNGGKKYEDGTGGIATHANNKVQPQLVRGNLGVPDSGIGPTKIMATLTKISTYVPPGQGRPSVWGREVSNGVFKSEASAINGRFVAFNPGHAGNEYTLAGGYVGALFLSTLRWVAKDDRGCKNPNASNYNALATINDGSCLPVSNYRKAILADRNSTWFGTISLKNSILSVRINQEGPHSVEVHRLNGEKVFQKQGKGKTEYEVQALENGFYFVLVKKESQAFQKLVSIMR